MTAQDPMLEASAIHKSFGDNHVLKGVSLMVAKGEVVTLIGASGSDKSTFLRCMNLLQVPEAGDLRVGEHRFKFRAPLQVSKDAQLARLRCDIGMVFQHFNLFSHMTALQNVIEAPIQVKGMGQAEAEVIARELLVKVGLGNKIDAYRAMAPPSEALRTVRIGHSMTASLRGRSPPADMRQWK